MTGDAVEAAQRPQLDMGTVAEIIARTEQRMLKYDEDHPSHHWWRATWAGVRAIASDEQLRISRLEHRAAAAADGTQRTEQ